MTDTLGSIKGDVAGQLPSTQRIRERAYFLWQEAGQPEGNDVAHWIMAEQELTGTGSIEGRETSTLPWLNANWLIERSVASPIAPAADA